MTLRADIGWDRSASSGDSEHWLSVAFEGLPSANAPASVAILVDTSTSMVGDRLEQARSAVASLVRTCRPDDRVAVFSFGSEVRRVVEARGGQAVADALGTLVAGGKTRLDLAMEAASAWLATRTGVRHLVLLTDGDPTDADGRRAPTQPLLDGAVALGRTGVRAAVVGLGRTEGYDSAFLRALADGCGGTSFVGVPPSLLAERALTALRTGQADSADVTLRVESGELTVIEAWRVAPRVQPLSAVGGAISLATANGGTILVHCRFTSALGATRGVRNVGILRVEGPATPALEIPLALNLVGPAALERNALDPMVDRLRVWVELARTAALRAASEDAKDQLRLTRRMSDLVELVGDPRATARVSSELRHLANGAILDREAREAAVEAVRDGGHDA
jgi:hypothetical protein